MSTSLHKFFTEHMLPQNLSVRSPELGMYACEVQQPGQLAAKWRCQQYKVAVSAWGACRCINSKENALRGCSAQGRVKSRNKYSILGSRGAEWPSCDAVNPLRAPVCQRLLSLDAGCSCYAGRSGQLPQAPCVCQRGQCACDTRPLWLAGWRSFRWSAGPGARRPPRPATCGRTCACPQARARARPSRSAPAAASTLRA